MAGLGFEVRHLAMETPRAMGWADVVREAGWVPDLALYADRSLPPPLVGLEEFPCLTAFYCIDSHIHAWYPMYAQGFDLCLASLRDHLERFRLRLGPDQVLWLPPAPTDDCRPAQTDKDWDLVFVGKVDPVTTPERFAFLNEMKKRLPGLMVRQGDFRGLFPRARLVLNIAERGDLNFRVFEALACGSCLLTPKIGHGQDDLFRDGEHLFTYPAGDAEALSELVHRLLAEPKLIRRVAAAGNRAVDAAHRFRHRAEALAGFLGGQDAAGLVRARLDQARDIRDKFLRLVFLHWAEEFGDSDLGRAYLKAARP
ncbi:MAG: glycosyltransferase [Desulfovibrionaceae bacterium]|nr:glycosyltransferase [Desulfovibrionaceae bacterium]